MNTPIFYCNIAILIMLFAILTAMGEAREELSIAMSGAQGEILAAMGKTQEELSSLHSRASAIVNDTRELNKNFKCVIGLVFEDEVKK